MTTSRSLVYDAPTRLFHWLFAGLFVTAFSIANLAEHSPVFPWHMMTGMLLVCLVALRLVWGLVGTRHARFSSFALNPRELLGYVRGIFMGGARSWPGHNPASSWAALVMMMLAVGLGFTGFMMTSGRASDAYEDVHEFLANAFLIVALAHVAGVVLHALRHRDGFPRSIVDGRKVEVPEAERIPGSRPGAALVMLALLAVAGVTLWRGYDAGSQSLAVAGVRLQLGEHGEGREAYGAHEADEGRESDHD